VTGIKDYESQTSHTVGRIRENGSFKKSRNVSEL